MRYNPLIMWHGDTINCQIFHDLLIVVRETPRCSFLGKLQAAFSARVFATEHRKSQPLPDIIATSSMVSFRSVTSQ